MNNKLFKIFVINYFGNLPKILEDLEVEKGAGGLIFCPMHDNYNTPAAKVFKDKTGWHFYCFTENKQFGTYDLYKHIYGYNMEQVFEALWNQLDDSTKNQMYDMFGEFDEDAPIENLEIFQEFKNRQINYEQLKSKLCVKISQES